MKKKIVQLSRDKIGTKKIFVPEQTETLEERLQENQLQLLNEETSQTLNSNYVDDNSRIENPNYPQHLKGDSTIDNADINNSLNTDNLTTTNNNEFNINGGFNVSVDSNMKWTLTIIKSSIGNPKLTNV